METNMQKGAIERLRKHGQDLQNGGKEDVKKLAQTVGLTAEMLADFLADEPVTAASCRLAQKGILDAMDKKIALKALPTDWKEAMWRIFGKSPLIVMGGMMGVAWILRSHLPIIIQAITHIAAEGG